MADDAPAPVPDNFIVLEFADGEYPFRLPVGLLAELQTKCGAGVGKIYGRLMAGRYLERSTGDVILNPLQAEFHAEDIYEVIRLGLIGGGQSPTDALRLVKTYVHPRPLLESWKIASAVLSAFLIGFVDPEARPTEKKSPAEAETVRAGSI